MIAKKEKITKAPNLQYMKDKDAELVKGIFKFHERPGGTLEFDYRFYKGPIEKYELTDNTVYDLPLGVARHLNKSGRYPIHEHKLDEFGHPSQTIGHNVARYGFHSLEFTDISDAINPSELIPEVTKVE